MAPISLKDPNIQGLTEEFVKALTGFKVAFTQITQRNINSNFKVKMPFFLAEIVQKFYTLCTVCSVEFSVSEIDRIHSLHTTKKGFITVEDYCSKYFDFMPADLDVSGLQAQRGEKFLFHPPPPPTSTGLRKPSPHFFQAKVVTITSFYCDGKAK